MNKKLRIFISSLLCLLILLVSSVCFAQENIKVVVNNKQLSFDVPPTVKDGRTLVPLRAIFESLNATVNWDDKTKTVTAVRENTKIELQVDSNKAKINGKELILDAPLQVINGRSMVPLRFIAESFGANVAWDDKTSTVIITDTNSSKIADNSNSSNSNETNNSINNNLNYLELNRYYDSSDNHMSVKVTDIKVEYKEGFKQYTVSYTEKNNIKDKAITQGSFKVYFKNGESQPQYGFFNDLYPGEEKSNVFIFKALKSQEPYCIEYGKDIFFNQSPNDETLKWRINN